MDTGEVMALLHLTDQCFHFLNNSKNADEIWQI